MSSQLQNGISVSPLPKKLSPVKEKLDQCPLLSQQHSPPKLFPFTHNSCDSESNDKSKADVCSPPELLPEVILTRRKALGAVKDCSLYDKCLEKSLNNFDTRYETLETVNQNLISQTFGYPTARRSRGRPRLHNSSVSRGLSLPSRGCANSQSLSPVPYRRGPGRPPKLYRYPPPFRNYSSRRSISGEVTRTKELRHCRLFRTRSQRRSGTPSSTDSGSVRLCTGKTRLKRWNSDSSQPAIRGRPRKRHHSCEFQSDSDVTCTKRPSLRSRACSEAPVSPKRQLSLRTRSKSLSSRNQKQIVARRHSSESLESLVSTGTANLQLVPSDDSFEEKHTFCSSAISTGRELKETVDGVEFTTFETEIDMAEYTIKQYEKFIDVLTDRIYAAGNIDDFYSPEGKQDSINSSDSLIHPTKTTDITKIKGWKNKQFLLNDCSKEEQPDVSVDTEVEEQQDLSSEQVNMVDDKSPFLSSELDDFLANSELKVSFEVPHNSAEKGISKNITEESLPIVSSAPEPPHRLLPPPSPRKGPKPKTLLEKRMFMTTGRFPKRKNIEESSANESNVDEIDARDILKPGRRVVKPGPPRGVYVEKGNTLVPLSSLGKRKTESTANTEDPNPKHLYILNEGRLLSIAGSRTDKPGPERMSIDNSTQAKKIHQKLNSTKSKSSEPLADSNVDEAWAKFAITAVVLPSRSPTSASSLSSSPPPSPPGASHGLRSKPNLGSSVKTNIADHLAEKIKKAKRKENRLSIGVDGIPAVLVERATELVSTNAAKRVTVGERSPENGTFCRRNAHSETSNVMDVTVSEKVDEQMKHVVPEKNEAQPSSNSEKPYEPVPKKPRVLRSKITRELMRLGANIIEVNTETQNKVDNPPNKRSNVPCNNDFCALGCVCDSLHSAGHRKPTICMSQHLELRNHKHCGKTECLDGLCSCQLNGDTWKNSTEGLQSLSRLSSTTVARWEDNASRHLAPVEREFKQTVVQADNEVVMVDSRRKRNIQLPKRFRDNVVAVGKDFAPIESVKGISPVSNNTNKSSEECDTPQQESKKRHSQSPPPTARSGIKLLPRAHQQIAASPLKKCFVNMKRLSLTGVSPWCMEHSDYDCRKCLEKLEENLSKYESLQGEQDATEPANTANQQLPPKCQKLATKRRSQVAKRSKGALHRRSRSSISPMKTAEDSEDFMPIMITDVRSLSSAEDPFKSINDTHSVSPVPNIVMTEDEERAALTLLATMVTGKKGEQVNVSWHCLRYLVLQRHCQAWYSSSRTPQLVIRISKVNFGAPRSGFEIIDDLKRIFPNEVTSKETDNFIMQGRHWELIPRNIEENFPADPLSVKEVPLSSLNDFHHNSQCSTEAITSLCVEPALVAQPHAPEAVDPLNTTHNDDYSECDVVEVLPSANINSSKVHTKIIVNASSKVPRMQFCHGQPNCVLLPQIDCGMVWSFVNINDASPDEEVILQVPYLNRWMKHSQMKNIIVVAGDRGSTASVQGSAKHKNMRDFAAYGVPGLKTHVIIGPYWPDTAVKEVQKLEITPETGNLTIVSKTCRKVTDAPMSTKENCTATTTSQSTSIAETPPDDSFKRTGRRKQSTLENKKDLISVVDPLDVSNFSNLIESPTEQVGSEFDITHAETYASSGDQWLEPFTVTSTQNKEGSSAKSVVPYTNSIVLPKDATFSCISPSASQKGSTPLSYVTAQGMTQMSRSNISAVPVSLLKNASGHVYPVIRKNGRSKVGIAYLTSGTSSTSSQTQLQAVSSSYTLVPTSAIHFAAPKNNLIASNGPNRPAAGVSLLKQSDVVENPAAAQHPLKKLQNIVAVLPTTTDNSANCDQNLPVQLPRWVSTNSLPHLRMVRPVPSGVKRLVAPAPHLRQYIRAPGHFVTRNPGVMLANQTVPRSVVRNSLTFESEFPDRTDGIGITTVTKENAT